MFKAGDVVVCAYSDGTDNLETHGEYTVRSVYNDEHGQRVDIHGEHCSGDYYAKRFMLKESMIKQVMENARNV